MTISFFSGFLAFGPGARHGRKTVQSCSLLTSDVRRSESGSAGGCESVSVFASAAARARKEGREILTKGLLVLLLLVPAKSACSRVGD